MPDTIHGGAVGLVEREQQPSATLRVKVTWSQPVTAGNVRAEIELGIVGDDDDAVFVVVAAPNRRLGTGVWSPAPRVAKPQVRQEVERRRIWTAIDRFDTDADVLRGGLPVLDHDVE